MNKGGTNAPTKRKTSGRAIGDVVVCTLAGSSWHKVGRVSTVVAHPRTGLASIEALDGHFDELCLCVSKFAAAGTSEAGEARRLEAVA